MSAEILNILVGMGVIAAVWRMSAQLAALTAQMKVYTNRTEDHEGRIRKLEKNPNGNIRLR